MSSTITTTNLNATNSVKIGNAFINSSDTTIVLPSVNMINVYETLQSGTTSSAEVSLDYSLGALSVISLDASSNFTLNITNVNATENTSASNTLTMLIDCTTYNGYCNNINVNGSAETLLFAGGSASIDVSGASWIIQTISIIYNGSGTIPSIVLSSVVSCLV